MTEKIKIVGFIPAHLASVRFKKKIMHRILGIPMIEHVRRRSIHSKVIEKIIVASGDREILNTVKKYGGETKETFKDHKNGTSRIGEALEDIDCSHVVIIQGDEPLIQTDHLKRITDAIRLNPSHDSWNSTCELNSKDELYNPNVVKAAINNEERILYFFRNSPSFKDPNEQFLYIKKVQGLIAFKKETLMQIVASPTNMCEEIESIEQLKIIANGFNIYSVYQKNQVPSINTREDLDDLYKYFENNNNELELTKTLLK